MISANPKNWRILKDWCKEPNGFIIIDNIPRKADVCYCRKSLTACRMYLQSGNNHAFATDLSYMDVSIITVTWNSKNTIRDQVHSVFSACRNITCEEIIVDNGSSDGTIEIVRALAQEHENIKTLKHENIETSQQIFFIVNKENRGFGAANNQGVEQARGRYILFLNPDMRLEEGSMDRLIAWMDAHQGVGIASPKLVHQDGTFNWEASPRRFPRVWEQLALLLKLPHLFPSLLDHYHMRDMDIEKEQEVDSVRGSCMLVRRELIDALGQAFDPRYFIWYEDVDICREAKRLGYSVMYAPEITAIDYVGQSFKQRTTLWKQKQFTKSMLVYFKKWEPWWKWILIALFRPFGILFACVGSIKKY